MKTKTEGPYFDAMSSSFEDEPMIYRNLTSSAQNFNCGVFQCGSAAESLRDIRLIIEDIAVPALDLRELFIHLEDLMSEDRCLFATRASSD